MGRYWPSFKLPEHIGFYDNRSLALLAAKAGMQLIRVFPYHHAFPLGLILAKLGFALAGKGRRMALSVLLPRVMMAAVFSKKLRD